MNQIADDLERKLFEDLQRALTHYAQMAKIAEVPFPEMWLCIFTLLLGRLISLGQHMDMPKALFVEVVADMWDRSAAKKKGTR